MIELFAADIPVSPGGPSAPAWVFFTAIVTMLGGIIIEGIRRFSRVDHKLDDARNVARKAVDNTENISNGFARGVNIKLDNLTEAVDKLQAAIMAHQQYHLERDKNNADR